MSGLSSTPTSESERNIQLQNELAWAKMKILSLEAQLRLPADQEVRPRQREARLRAIGASGTGARGEPPGGPRREPARATAGGKGEEPQTSRTAGTAGRTAACGTCDRLHAGTAHLQGLRPGDGGDRLRDQRAVGRRARQVLRGGDQARKARLQMLPGRRRDGGRGAGPDRREGTGERPGGDRHGGGEVQRSSAAVPPERDSGSRGGRRDQPGDAGWMGDAGGRVTQSHRLRDAPRVTRRKLPSSG